MMATSNGPEVFRPIFGIFTSFFFRYTMSTKDNVGSKDDWRKQKGHLAEKKEGREDKLKKELIAGAAEKKKDQKKQDDPNESPLINRTSVRN